MDYSVEGIFTQIMDRVEEKFQRLVDIICVELAYTIMFSPKYAVSHEFDPPWDHSGMLIKLNEGFSSKDYASVADFLEEYTGESKASFMSRHGFFHVKYEEYFEDMIREFVFECYCDVLSEIDREVVIELLIKSGYDLSEEDKVDLIRNHTEFERFELSELFELFDYPIWHRYELLERIQMMNFEWMILRGKEGALAKRATPLQVSKESNKKAEIEKEAADTLWHKLQKLYKLQTGNQLSKIEMKDYNHFREFLDFNQVSREERILLAQQLSDNFSH